MSARVPTEHAEQAALIRWARLSEKAHPELRNLFAIGNGGARTAITGARMKAEGISRGVPDLMLAWPANGWGGLFIELKRHSGGRVSPEQQEWLTRLRAANYCPLVCDGWDAAREAICDYLGIEGSCNEHPR